MTPNPTDKSDPVFVEVVEALTDEELGHLKNAIMIAERTSLATVYVPIVTAKKIIELSSIAGRLEAAENMLAIADNIIETVALPSSNKGIGEFYDRFYVWLDKARAVQKRIAALSQATEKT